MIFIACALLMLVPAAHGWEPTVHHRLSVRLDLASARLAGVDHVRLSGRGPRTFELAPGLRVKSLVVDGAPRAAQPDGGRWKLELDDRETHEIAVEYEGSPSGDESGLLIDPSGSFLAGSGWYPSFGEELLSYDLTVRAPPDQRAVSPGKILAEKTGQSGYEARFASEGPVQEIALFVGPYVVGEARHDEIRLRTYFHPEVADLNALYLEKTAGYLELYQHWIGDYPYSAFYVVSGTMPFGLGFPGLTYVGARVLRLPFLPETSLGHEVLHSWWGNAVLVDPEQGNWAEGLTTFMADYTYARRKSRAEARDMRLRWMREYAALPPAQDRPLTSFRSRGHTASQVVGYHKAAMLFVMLRDLLGRGAFDEGIRRFWRETRFRKAGWRDLRRAFEASAGGRSLEQFFGQWLERTGAPNLVLRDAEVRDTETGFEIEFTIAQGEPPYELRVPVVIETATGRVRQSIRLEGPVQSGRMGVKTPPRSLCVDPDFRLFRRPLPGETAPILRAAAFDPSTMTVLAAPDAGTRAAALELAARLLERPPRLSEPASTPPVGTLLVVGTTDAVAQWLSRKALPPPPASIAGKGTARAWALRREEGSPIVVVAGADAASLGAAARPLPHHGSQSFVVFDGPTAVERGVWPVQSRPLCADLKGHAR